MLYFKLNPFEVIEENVNGDPYKYLIQSKTTLSFGTRSFDAKDSQEVLDQHVQEIKKAFEDDPCLLNTTCDVIDEPTTQGHTKEKTTKEYKLEMWRPGRYDYYGDDGYWYDYYKTEIVDVWREYPIINKTVTIKAVVHKSNLGLVDNLNKENDYIRFYRHREKVNKFKNVFCAFFPILALLITGFIIWAQAYGKIFLAQWAEYSEFFNYVFYDYGKTQPLFLELLYFLIGTIWELLKYILLILPFIFALIAMFGSKKKKVSTTIVKNVFLTAISVALLIVETQVIFTMYL